MKATMKRQLVAGLILVAGFPGGRQSALADSPTTSLSFTIHVRNDAGVDSKTLKEAETAATGILHNAGVASHWVDAPPTSQDLQVASIDQPSFGPLTFG